MELEYKSKKLRDQCIDFRVAKRKMSIRDAEGLLKAINIIEEATSMQDVIRYGPFDFHPLLGDKKRLYSIDVNGRTSSYCLYLKRIDGDSRNINDAASSIKKLRYGRYIKND